MTDADADRAALPQAEPEVCICAALQMPDGYVVRGHRHDGAIKTAGGMSRYTREHIYEAEQGFVTSRNRFVGREEGARLMRAVDWHDPKTGLPFLADVLFSEDLY